MALFRGESFAERWFDRDVRTWRYDPPRVMAAVHGYHYGSPDLFVDYVGDGADAEATVKGIIAAWAAAS